MAYVEASASKGDRSLPARTVDVLISATILLTLAGLARILDVNVPNWLPQAGWVRTIEAPVYAIATGLLGGGVLAALGIREQFSGAFRTEFFIKTGLVLLGAAINIEVVLRAAGPALVQSLILITVVFFATWWFAGWLGLEDKLRALLAAAVSICGVSAAIAAAGAVQAKKEQLAYVASLVIAVAVPSIFLQPWFAGILGLPQTVAGAWIGGNIDTTAAVTAAGSLYGEDALKIAAIVKQTQNAMIGVVAFLLTLYFVVRIEKGSQQSLGIGALWDRFPKFILGFVVASVAGTLLVTTSGNTAAANAAVAVAGTQLRTWFFILAFVCIGLEFRIASFREAGYRPLVVFGAATVLNLALALALATTLFSGLSLST